MHKSGLILGVVAALFVSVAMGCAWPPSADATQVGTSGSEQSIEGSVAAMTSSIRRTADTPDEPPSVSLVLRTDGGLLTVIVSEGAEVIAADGQPIAANEVPLSARVRVEGRRLSPTQFEAATVEVLA